MSTDDREPPADEGVGELEPGATFDGAMPTGVTVSHDGRIFVNHPKWGDDVAFTVAEIRDGEEVAYPSRDFNATKEDDLAAALVSVQSVVVDPANRPWILDTAPAGRPPGWRGRPAQALRVVPGAHRPAARAAEVIRP